MPPTEQPRPSLPARGRSVLAFLAGHGFSLETLAEAEALAERWGVSADIALVRSGLASAERLLRALAAECGLPFLDNPRPHPLARFPQAVLSGVLPLADRPDGLTYALAPEGELLADLLAKRGRLAPGLAIVAPDILRTALMKARAEPIAREAAEGLPAARPDESYRDGPTAAQYAAVYAAGLLTAALFAAFPAGMIQFGSALLSLPFLGLIAVKLGATLERVGTAPAFPLPRVAERDLPTYTILVPLFREARVLPKLLRALASLDYPAAKLQALLIVEEDDRETRDALSRHALPPFVTVVVAPRGAPRTKPRALNVALPLARGELVVVYDAEDVPDPGQLRLAVATFERSAPDIACLQARLVIDNTADGVLPAFFTVEYGTLFDVVNPALPRFDLPVPLGGTSNHFRTEVLRALGGWDPWNVTEDADLAIRLATAGHRVADLPSATLEEAPRTLRAWLAQRTRWMKGFIQVTITHSRKPVQNLSRLGPVRLFGAMSVTVGVVVSALVYPIFTAFVAWGLWSGEYLRADGWADLVAGSIGLATAFAGVLAMTVPGFVALARRGWWELWPYAILMPFYYLLVSVAAWRGVVELALDPDRWNKTEHGLARTSRALTGAAAGPARPGRVRARR